MLGDIIADSRATSPGIRNAERVLEQLLCCQIAARLARSADRAVLCLNPIRTQKPPLSFGCPHHRRCGTGIWPDRDITVRRPDVSASCTSLPTAPLAPARTPAVKPGLPTYECVISHQTRYAL